MHKKLMVRTSIAIATTVLLASVAWAHWHILVRESKPQESGRHQSQPQSEPQPSYVDMAIQNMTLRDKVASLFIFHTPGTGPSALSSYFTTYKPSGLIFMGDNIPHTFSELRAETGALVTDKQLPPLMAVDEEGDTVTRLGADNFPGALQLRNRPPEAAKDAFSARSHMLKSVGLNLNFGIIADVTDDPNSFIYPRVLGTTAQAASERVKAAVEGSKGVTLTTIKHFPGHGETPDDSHSTIPTAITSFEDWKDRVALPFKAGIDAGADVVMFGHLRYSAVDDQPATLSKKWHDIIRNDLDFKGVIITDDMVMLQNSGNSDYADPVQNAIAALKAGNDLLLYVLDHGGGNSDIDPNTLINGVSAAVSDGRLDKKRIDGHVRSVLDMRHSLKDQ